jgi:hypothetical protein
VSALLASIHQNINVVHAPPPMEDTGPKLNFVEDETDFEPVTSEMILPFKPEQEGGVGTYILSGGGTRQCH